MILDKITAHCPIRKKHKGLKLKDGRIRLIKTGIVVTMVTLSFAPLTLL